MTTLRKVFATMVIMSAVGVHNIQWREFVNTKSRYKISYPASWYLFTNQLAPNPEILDILNFPPDERVQGVVLKPHGAEITVSQAPTAIKTIDEWINEAGSKSYVEVRREEFSNIKRSTSGCVKVVRVTSEWDTESSGQWQVITDTYCLTGRGLYDVSLINWKGDPNQSNLQGVALKMTLSFKLY
ncbi:MAG TPA: hypothetical protein VJP02_14360 [Candidatus Sulfotelmatobacter sp.]|nr:hypothetical protein [Candidatus Sulfotelmatobacter sp.]